MIEYGSNAVLEKIYVVCSLLYGSFEQIVQP